MNQNGHFPPDTGSVSTTQQRGVIHSGYTPTLPVKIIATRCRIGLKHPIDVIQVTVIEGTDQDGGGVRHHDTLHLGEAENRLRGFVSRCRYRGIPADMPEIPEQISEEFIPTPRQGGFPYE